jgi:hypothetical protein
MRHHFGDFLDRDGYWTVIPNRERYAYRIGDVPAGSPEVTIVTIGKEDENWSRALTLPNLAELTLHAPTQEQLLAVRALRSLKRLRITHARPRTIDFISPMSELEELVLEYVSGFSDLAPVGSLKRLRALHIENLRRVSDFSGLSGATELKYLAIHGTTDWEQPIDNFEFLRGLRRLELFALWQVNCRAPYPAMLPALSLRNLKRLRLHGSYFATDEYALLEEGGRGGDLGAVPHRGNLADRTAARRFAGSLPRGSHSDKTPGSYGLPRWRTPDRGPGLSMVRIHRKGGRKSEVQQRQCGRKVS